MEDNNSNSTNFVQTGTVTTSFEKYSINFIEANEVGDTVEFIYEEVPNFVYTNMQPENKVFKIVFSCKDGLWNKSDRIYGIIIPSTEEYYEFE
jgi:hypothetical protein